jgi:DNA relaxase NicK
LSDDVEEMKLTSCLFDILKLNMKEYDSCRGDSNFASKALFNGNTFLYYDPIGIMPSGVSDYFIIEMTGSACRSFELRGGSWLDLAKFVSSTSHHMTRFDLAMDDLGGIIPLEDYVDGNNFFHKGLKSKCRDMEFVSAFRSSNPVRVGKTEACIKPLDDSDEFNTHDVIDSAKGWSITFGKKERLQLQIYDKKAERCAKGVHTGLNSWVRFEMRFGSVDDRADSIFYLWYSSLLQGLVGHLACQLLRWLLDFKEVEGKKEDRNHFYRLDEWKPYQEFLSVQGALKLPCNQARIEADVTTSVSWIMNQWAKTAITLCKISRNYFLSVLANSMSRYKERKGIDNSIEGQVKDFYLMFPDELGAYDKEYSDNQVDSFIREFSDGSIRDGSEDGEDGIFAWNSYVK